MFDNETPMIAWLAVGSVYVVGGCQSKSQYCVMVHFTERLLFTSIYIERKPGLFTAGTGDWITKLTISICQYQHTQLSNSHSQHRNLSTGSWGANQVRRNSLKSCHCLKILTLLLFEGKRRAREALYIWTTNFETRVSLTMLQAVILFLEMNDKHTDMFFFLFLNFKTLS